LTDIGSDSPGFASTFADFQDGAIQLPSIPRNENDASSAVCERHGQGATESAAASGDECGSVSNFHGFLLLTPIIGEAC
jgi:hypothetical protein